LGTYVDKYKLVSSTVYKMLFIWNLHIQVPMISSFRRKQWNLSDWKKHNLAPDLVLVDVSKYSLLQTTDW